MELGQDLLRELALLTLVESPRRAKQSVPGRSKSTRPRMPPFPDMRPPANRVRAGFVTFSGKWRAFDSGRWRARSKVRPSDASATSGSSYGTLAGLGGHGCGSTLATPLFVFAASDLASIATGSTLIVDPRHDAAAFSPGAAPRPDPG